MTFKEFKELLDTYGSDLGKWPQEHRVTAVTLIGGSAAAKQAFADACAFDAALRYGGNQLSPARRRALIDDIMAAVDAQDGARDATTDRAAEPNETSAAGSKACRTDEGASGSPPPAGSVEAVALLLGGVVAHLSGADMPPIGQADGLHRIMCQAIDDVLTGDRRAEARAALDRRRQACDAGLAAHAPPDDVPHNDEASPDAGAIGDAFLAGNLTDAMVATSVVTLEARLGLVLGGLLDLSKLLDRGDRERFLAAVAAKARA